MKKLFALLIILLVTAVWVSALEIMTEDQLLELGLSEDQIAQVLEIQNTYRNQIREAALEMNVYKAQLEKMLYSENPDMDKVRKLLEESLKWRLQSEMAAIKERTETRKVLGEEKWQEMLRLRKRLQEQKKIELQNQTRPQPRPQLPGSTRNGQGK